MVFTASSGSHLARLMKTASYWISVIPSLPCKHFQLHLQVSMHCSRPQPNSCGEVGVLSEGGALHPFF